MSPSMNINESILENMNKYENAISNIVAIHKVCA